MNKREKRRYDTSFSLACSYETAKELREMGREIHKITGLYRHEYFPQALKLYLKNIKREA